MKFDSKSILAITVATLLAVSFEFVHAGCPNACSGNGVCIAGDMCQCNRNWAGADCSQRVCPFGYAHVTTPLADWNSDGNRGDNTDQLLSATCAQNLLSTSVTLGAALKPGELEAGDGLRIGGQDFIVISISGTAVVVDKVRATTSPNGVAETGNYAAGVCFKLVKSQANPAGTWESWPGDFPGHMDALGDATKLAKCPNTETVNGAFAVQSTAPNGDCADEGHYYMECSNRGVCDRKAGTCKCFPGYDGTSCQRTVCPNDCSGHGTCEKVSELASMRPNKLACVASGSRGSTTLTFFSYTGASQAADCNVAKDDVLFVGDDPKPYTISAALTGGSLDVTLNRPLSEDVPRGSPVRLQPAYVLWDADKNRACKCDSGYSGFDCSERKCPFGDDPLTTNQQFETQVVHVGSANPENKITGSFKLVFEDMFGEKWTTASIPVDGGVDKSSNVKAALTALPNDVVQDVTVTSININGKGVRYMVKFDGGATLTATGNSGDLPNMGCDGSSLEVRLTEAFTNNAGAWSTNTYAFTSGSEPASSTVMPADLINDGTNDFVVESAVYAASNKITSITVAAGSGNNPSGVAITVLRKISGGVECTVSDTHTLLKSRWGVVQDATPTTLTATCAAGGNSLVFSATPASAPVANDILLVQLADGTNAAQVVVASFTTATATLAANCPMDYPAGSKVYKGDSAQSVTEVTIAANTILATGTANHGTITTAVAVDGVSVGSKVMISATQTLIPVKDAAGTVLTATAPTSGGGTTVTLSATPDYAVTFGSAFTPSGTTKYVIMKADNTAPEEVTFASATGAAITIAATVTTDFAAGSKIFIANGPGHEVLTLSDWNVEKTTLNTVEKLTKNYGAGTRLDFYGKGTSEKKSCSGRGLCDIGSGTCKCFKGYTMDDCSRQNTLAL